MSRPANVRNPFDWKRSMIVDLHTAGAITIGQRDRLLGIVDQDEREDRVEGERELAARAQRLDERPWWKKLLP
jgi:hypothetical protein